MRIKILFIILMAEKKYTASKEGESIRTCDATKYYTCAEKQGAM